MLVALLMPEVIVLWAMRQWVASRSLQKEYQGAPSLSPTFIPNFSLQSSSLDFNWTKTHAYFALMGGFVYKKNRNDLDAHGALGYPYEHPLSTLIRHKKIILSDKDIKDRSKGDIISKSLVLVQTPWFVIQFLARISQRLPVTKLELVTLAYTVLNFTTYFFWWNKPQNLSCPVRVYADEIRSLRNVTLPKTEDPQAADMPNDLPSELTEPNIEDRVREPSDKDTTPFPLITVEKEVHLFSSRLGHVASLARIFKALLVGGDFLNVCAHAELSYPSFFSEGEKSHVFGFASLLAAIFEAMHIAG